MIIRVGSKKYAQFMFLAEQETHFTVVNHNILQRHVKVMSFLMFFDSSAKEREFFQQRLDHRKW